MLKWLLFAFSTLLLAGCDFDVPLSGEPEMMIDTRALGLWERVNPDGDTERLLVMALNEKEYVICWPKGNPTELYARAFLFEYSGRTLVQLQWFGNSDGDVADSDRNFQVAAYAVTGDELEIHLLNADVTGKDFTSSADLAAAMEKHRDHPELFRDVMIFRKHG